MIENKEELMVPPTSGVHPTLRIAHFIKTILNPENPSLPNPHPHLSLSSNSTTNIHDQIRKRVHFKGRIRQQKGWRDWVETLQQAHQETWKKAGIFDAIRASVYDIRRHDELIIWLAQKWCTDTNTFIFPWGEATITLEDVLILGGFSLLGGSVHCPVSDPECKEFENRLTDICREMKQSSLNFHVRHDQWMNYFKGSDGELENVAFIVLWLSRYVFPTDFYGKVSPRIFPMAISLTRGTRFALAPAVLAHIYRDLSLLKQKIMTLITKGSNDDGLDLFLWAPLQLVQVWAWERLPTLSPKPNHIAPGEPRLARWHDVKKPKHEFLEEDTGFVGDEFVLRPYTLPLKNWVPPKFYPDQEKWVLMNSNVVEDLLSWARCLRPSALVGMDCVEQYLPHRVGMQFGMDKNVPSLLIRLNDDIGLAWSSYAKPLDGLKLYLPPRLFEGDVTIQYSNWRRDVFSLNNEARILCERRKRSHRQSKRVQKRKITDIIPFQFSQDLVNEGAQQCQETVIERDKGQKSKTESIVEILKEPGMPNQACVDIDNSEQQKKDSEEDDRDFDPYKILAGYELEARICRLEEQISYLKEAR